MCPHGHDLWNDGFVGPFDTEYFSQFLQVLRRSFTDGEDCIAQPAHAESGELLIEEFHAQLACQERDVFNDGQANSPLFVFSELNNCGKEGLREKLDANNCLY